MASLKNVVSFLLVSMMVLVLSACGGTTSPQPTPEPQPNPTPNPRPNTYPYLSLMQFELKKNTDGSLVRCTQGDLGMLNNQNVLTRYTKGKVAENLPRNANLLMGNLFPDKYKLYTMGAGDQCVNHQSLRWMAYEPRSGFAFGSLWSGIARQWVYAVSRTENITCETPDIFCITDTTSIPQLASALTRNDPDPGAPTD